LLKLLFFKSESFSYPVDLSKDDSYYGDGCPNYHPSYGI